MATNILSDLPTPAGPVELPESCPICERKHTVHLGAIYVGSGWHATLLCTACRHIVPTAMESGPNPLTDPTGIPHKAVTRSTP